MFFVMTLLGPMPSALRPKSHYIATNDLCDDASEQVSERILSHISPTSDTFASYATLICALTRALTRLSTGD